MTRLGLWRLKYKEGLCLEFGRVKPVHLDDVSSIERRVTISKTKVVLTTRLVWLNPYFIPTMGSFISLHSQYGRTLMQVERIGLSCVCCRDRALTFIHVVTVDGVMPIDKVCRCAATKGWTETENWDDPVEQGLCRKSGSDTIKKVAEAIRRWKNR